MNLEKSILQGFAVLAEDTLTFDGESYSCIYNTATNLDNKVLGGFEPDEEVALMVKASDFSSPHTLKGEILNVQDRDYRIVRIRLGNFVTTLYCQSPEKL